MPEENTTQNATPETQLTQTTESQVSSSTTSPATESTTNDPSLLNAETPETTAESTAPKAPDAYEFKLPDGVTLDPKLVDEVTPILKELGLSNDNAQKLVDWYNKHTGDTVTSLQESNRATRTEWQSESKTWMNANGGEAAVKTDVGRALNSVFANADGTPDTKAIGEFKKYMDWTFAGDNPYFIRAFATMAKSFNEGKAVQGSGPSQFGQQKPGTGQRPSLAQAVYGPDGPRREPIRNPNGSPQGG
jgi:hypothetical protein